VYSSDNRARSIWTTDLLVGFSLEQVITGSNAYLVKLSNGLLRTWPTNYRWNLVVFTVFCVMSQTRWVRHDIQMIDRASCYIHLWVSHGRLERSGTPGLLQKIVVSIFAGVKFELCLQTSGCSRWMGKSSMRQTINIRQSVKANGSQPGERKHEKRIKSLTRWHNQNNVKNNNIAVKDSLYVNIPERPFCFCWLLLAYQIEMTPYLKYNPDPEAMRV